MVCLRALPLRRMFHFGNLPPPTFPLFLGSLVNGVPPAPISLLFSSGWILSAGKSVRTENGGAQQIL